MTNMKRTLSYFIAYLGIPCMLLLSSCGDPNLSKGEAKEILEKHIGKCYGLAIPPNVTLTPPSNIRFKHVRLARDLELVDTAQTAGASGQRASDSYDVTLTEKGASHPYFEDKHKNIMFLVSENKIDEIIEIKKDKENQFTVLFSYTQSYNNLGKVIALEMQQQDLSWIEDNSRFRGRAHLAYDRYLKSFVIKGMMWSEWEKEAWRPALFASNAEKQTAFYYSYEHQELAAPPTQASPSQALNALRREHAREIERKISEKREAMMEQQRMQMEKRSEAARRASEERQREFDRERTRMELRRLEREAETMRANEERARQMREYERRKTERDLNKNLIR